MTKLLLLLQLFALPLIVAVAAAKNAAATKSDAVSAVKNRKLQLPITFGDKIKHTIDKSTYIYGESIMSTLVSKTGATIFNGNPTWSTTIMPESQIQNLLNPSFIINDFGRIPRFANGTVLKYEWLFGRYSGDFYRLVANGKKYSAKQMGTSTNVTAPSQTVLDTKYVVVITQRVYSSFDNNYTTNVVTYSPPFTFKLNSINMTTNKRSYKPGEKIKLGFTKQLLPNPEPLNSYLTSDYIKIYKVPSSYRNDLLKFNNATQAKHSYYGNAEIIPMSDHLITWTEPGKYQAVYLRFPEQIILGTSDVFDVIKPSLVKNIIVTMDNTTYSPHQTMRFNITADRKLDNRLVTFSFAYANATTKDFSDSTKILDFVTQKWQYESKYELFNVRNYMTKPGFYKIGITISTTEKGANYALHVTQIFTVTRPQISINTIEPRRSTFFEGENVRLQIDSLDFSDLWFRDYIAKFIITVVSAGYPAVETTVGPLYYENIYFDGMNVVFPPGQYQFVVFSQSRFDYPVAYEFISRLNNASFTVVPNPATVVTEKATYKMDDKINITLTLSQNVSLSRGPMPLWQVKAIQSDTPSTNITEVFYEGSFDYNNYNYGLGQFSSGGNQLFGRAYVTWNITGIFKIVVTYGKAKGQTGVWAESAPFTVSK